MSSKKLPHEVVVCMVKRVLVNRKDIKVTDTLIREATSYIFKIYYSDIIKNKISLLNYLNNNEYKLLEIIELIAITNIAIDFALIKRRNNKNSDTIFS